MKISIRIFFLILLSNNLFAQGTIFGLEKYNLGIIRPNYSSAGLGRSFEVADTDSLHLNYMNFATWTNISYTTYEVDALYTASKSKDSNSNSYFRDYGSFQGGFLALPIIPQKFVIGIGLQPFIQMEHTVKDTIGDVSNDYTVIKGGLSRLTFNVSYKPITSFGFGIGYEYNFGRIEELYRMQMIEYGDQFDMNFEYRFGGHGIVTSAFFKPSELYSIGVFYRLPVKMNYNIYSETGNSYIDDEILKKEMTLPTQLNIGAIVNLSRKLRLGADVIYQNWKKGYKIEDNTISNQSDYMRLGFGFELKESEKRFTSFFNTLNYRMGVFFGNQKVNNMDNSVREYGLSMGVSLPLRRFISRVDFSGLLGRRGNLSNNYYEENFLQFGISISTNEMWFFNIED